MKRFEVYRKSNFVGTVKAVSLRQAVTTADRRYGDCEVYPIDGIARPDRFNGANGKTRRQQERNTSAEAKARIEAIRQAEIAKWAAKA